jgi:hypothetical protein
MSEKLTITIKDKNIQEIERIKEKCDKFNISFSAFCVDSIISNWRISTFEDKE